ncbi:MAG: alpha/beta hydrolase [Burkholderiaceae bacterium]|nr:alpha/beta hydrolase [Burkholderiaceae bacterium]
MGGNRSNWSGQLAHFGERYCCVAWDARGYGSSDDPGSELAFDDFADDLEGLLDHLGAERAHIVGLSMGGFIAQDFCARYPQRVATLTLAATSAGANLFTSAEREDFLAKRLRPLEAGASMADMARGLIDVLAGPRADAAVRDRLCRSLESLRPESYKQTLRALVATDFRASLARISVPTLIVVGDHDRVLPEAESHFLAGHIADHQLRVIPRAGHLCNIEAGDEFDAILSDFLLLHADAGASTLRP